MGKSTSIQWHGREVRHPAARITLGFIYLLFALITGTASMTLGVITAVFGLVVLTPIALVLHPILRAFGRQGTIEREANRVQVLLTRASFQKR